MGRRRAAAFLAVLPLLIALSVPATLSLLVAGGCGGGAGRGRGTLPAGAGAAPVRLVVPAADGSGDLAVGALRGRVVVLHFFTTWSIAAQLDVKELARARTAGAEVLGVALDPEAAALLPPWREAAGADYPIGLGDAAALMRGEGMGVPVREVPTTVVLDDRGRIAWWHEGGLAEGQLVREIGKLRGRRGR